MSRKFILLFPFSDPPLSPMATDTPERSLEPLSLSSCDQRLMSLEKQLDIELKVRNHWFTF